MSMLSRKAARDIIDSIRQDNGGISQADRENTPPAVLKALDSVRAKLGASTKTLATNIYSKDTRFVFELIQNAEDNEYKRALAANEAVYIKFSVYPEKVIVDFNEDGFTEANVRAICSVGQSTKAFTQGYIGEKGIGFKSVFKIASWVHIQSGPFSFSFEHQHGQNGLGIITPENQEHEELPEDVYTRMTLRLTDPTKFEQRVADLLELPDTLLLFLKRLVRITICIHRPNQPLSEIAYSYHEDKGNPIVKLIKVSGPAGDRQETTSFYHIARRQLSNLPTDGTQKRTDKAEVVLAFPVDSNSVPVIQPQHVFAYLPLRKVGFSVCYTIVGSKYRRLIKEQFLIQSDFLTQASREDVVRSDRNEAILDGVAETFRDAVLTFCEHPSLQYEWLSYLPGNSISDDFWAQLPQKIGTLLQRTEVLRTRGQGTLKRPKDIRYLPPVYLDRYDEPLFDDLVDEIYLSSKYKDFIKLQELEVSNINYTEIFDRIRVDAKRSNPKITASTSGEDWHTRVAKLLIEPFEQDWPGILNHLRGLEIIPLQDGRLISSNQGPLYYPDNDGVPVPTDLNRRLVELSATQNRDRRKLFSKLGVRRCAPEQVIDLIYGRYQEYPRVTLECSIAHLRYMYWHLRTDATSLDKLIYLKDQNNQAVYRQSPDCVDPSIYVDDVYFESDDEYGIQRLMRRGSPLTIHFIHPTYLKAVAKRARRGGRSWKSWLEEVVGVRRIPRLIESSNPCTLSKVFIHIVMWCPEKLIGTLQAHWSSYSSLMKPEIVATLENMPVPCENLGMPSLKMTYLPLPDLKDKGKQFGAEGVLPFLQLPTQLTKDSEQCWEFLKVFKVGMEADIRFYVDVLRYLVRDNPATEHRKGLFEVYKAIEAHSRADDYDAVREVFKEEKLIYVPALGSRAATWALPKDCVWNAPEFLRVKHPLAPAKDYQGNEAFPRLFTRILLIPHATHMDYIHELEWIRRLDSVNPSEVEEIYGRLWRMKGDRTVWPEIVQYFEVSLLIYVLPEKKWYSTSSCLWAEATRIAQTVAIATQYAALQDFFQRLGVKVPNIDTLIQELKALAHGERATIGEVKHFMFEINRREPKEGALEELKSLNILPVKRANGTVILRSTGKKFSIVDRREYGNAFEGKAPILHFTMEEVHEMQPFLSALGLQGRYMSRIVEEKSTVEGGERDPDLSHKFRQKAYALFRCAVHFKSHKVRDGDRSLYNTLLATDVYRSDGFSKTLTLCQGGSRITVESGKANLHIKEDNKNLTLFVPRDSTARERCYLSQLPNELLGYLAISDTAAKSTLTAVLTGSQSVLDDLLEDYGIIEVPGLVPLQSTTQYEEDLEYHTVETDSATSSSARQQRATPVAASDRSPTQGPFTPTTTPSPNSFAGGSTTSANWSNSGLPSAFHPPERTSLSAHPITPIPSPSRPSSPENQGPASRVFGSNEGYRTLLDRVITAASRAGFPSPSLFDRNGRLLPTASSTGTNPQRTTLSDAVFGNRSQNQVSHDMKIGAAGELFVFEMLLRLQLPGFTRDNWKSNIRGEVKIHRKYSDMESWNGAETADITYNDIHGNFTRLLIDKGYLPSTVWQNARPFYYLEVKTTTKECNTRFFMSKSQYQRMGQMALTDGQAAIQVYMILRVFDLGQDEIGLRIYLDPETLRRKNSLRFTAESYCVEPT